MPERSRVLQLGPDVPGGMREATRELLASPLAERYRLEAVATHRGSGAVRRLAVYALAAFRLAGWSLRGRGRIVHIHATVRGSMYRKAVLVLLARALRRRVVLHVHSGPGDIATFRAGVHGSRLRLLRSSFRHADVILAVSSASAAGLESAFGARGVLVLLNAAPRGPDELPRRGGDGNRPLAVYLGGFANPVKGGGVLLAALHEMDAALPRVAIAGPGKLPVAGSRLLRLREGVEWLGWLGPGDRDELLLRAEIFILASTSEGLPMALLEARSYGLAIVATEVGGVPDVVEADRQALLVPPGDAAALARGLSRLATDAEVRARLGRAARERSRELGPAAMATRLDAVYRRLL